MHASGSFSDNFTCLVNAQPLTLTFLATVQALPGGLFSQNRLSDPWGTKCRARKQRGLYETGSILPHLMYKSCRTPEINFTQSDNSWGGGGIFFVPSKTVQQREFGVVWHILCSQCRNIGGGAESGTSPADFCVLKTAASIHKNSGKVTLTGSLHPMTRQAFAHP